ncbi:MAG: histidine--tRNA ligase [Deltaproteobacteria bacterium GWA2_57_13]|nr:MAG: histidine--tRNA ligase [Deltaproteobacteria bacterium GWA2_57_13]
MNIQTLKGLPRTLQALRGFRDFLPEEAAKRKWLRDKLAQICESWGFSPLETPTLEPLEIFTGVIGEDEKLFFKFQDPGDRDVALRYDQTVPTCRVVAQYQNQLIFPFKRYQIQPAFRAEKPQKGRYREFTQVDADIFGVKTPDADAETIALSLDIYRQLGFKQALVRINSRALFKDMPYEAIVSIDKIKKIGDDGVIKEMETKGIALPKAKEYLSYVKNLEPNEEIAFILKYIDDYGFPEDWCVFDPTIARSFSYSMGPIWEVEIPDAGDQSVLGGERYDGLVEKFSGKDIGGTGFGLGFDRTLEAAQTLGLIPNLATNRSVLVTIFSADAQKRSIQISSSLRRQGLSVDLYPAADKLDKQLKYADRKGIPYVVIQGPEEVGKGVVKLKDMKAQTQEELTIDAVIQKLCP